jgi:hypothetical protein
MKHTLKRPLAITLTLLLGSLVIAIIRRPMAVLELICVTTVLGTLAGIPLYGLWLFFKGKGPLRQIFGVILFFAFGIFDIFIVCFFLALP